MKDLDPDSPLVSIIIPTYNRCDLLVQALQSVVNQSYSNWEVLVVDDGSTEAVEETVKLFSNHRVIYHRQLNQGPSVARNAGVQLAKGAFIAFLDSDDMLEPGCLEDKLALAKRHPDAGVIGGGCRYIDYDGNIISSYTRPRKSVLYEDLAIWTAFPGATGNIFCKRDLLINAGGFRAHLLDSEDRDLLRRLVELKPIVSVDRSTLIMRDHVTPRVNRDLSSLIYSRKWVSRQITDPGLRRASNAWNEHVFATKYWQSGRKISAIIHWIYSFSIHPAELRPELQRIREIGKLLLR